MPPGHTGSPTAAKVLVAPGLPPHLPIEYTANLKLHPTATRTSALTVEGEQVGPILGTHEIVEFHVHYKQVLPKYLGVSANPLLDVLALPYIEGDEGLRLDPSLSCSNPPRSRISYPSPRLAR